MPDRKRIREKDTNGWMTSVTMHGEYVEGYLLADCPILYPVPVQPTMLKF